MEYKKIIKSRQMRLKILRFFSFIPDRVMLKIQYRIKTGRKLDLKNPKRFTEKLQWYKLYYKNPLLIQCVDKYDVRDYVRSRGLEKILVPCCGIYNSIDDINWDFLPNKFVMKDTLGGGGNSVIIVKNKEKANIDMIFTEVGKWTKIDQKKKSSGREWPYYSGKKHRIIIEDYIDSDEYEGGLIDYKFFCFNGKTEFVYVMGERTLGKSVNVSIFDRDFNLLPVLRVGDEKFSSVKRPNNYTEMRGIAETLAADFPHVRVDLYNVNGKVLFGELTFFNASGYMEYDPDQFDVEIGDKWRLDTSKRFNFTGGKNAEGINNSCYPYIQ